jgi:hypothetical protein
MRLAAALTHFGSARMVDVLGRVRPAPGGPPPARATDRPAEIVLSDRYPNAGALRAVAGDA